MRRSFDASGEPSLQFVHDRVVSAENPDPPCVVVVADHLPADESWLDLYAAHGVALVAADDLSPWFDALGQTLVDAKKQPAKEHVAS